MKGLKPLIFDAAPLIYLCKIGFSFIFTEFPENKYTPPMVVEEVVNRGKRLRALDAFIAERMIKESIPKVREPKEGKLINQLMKISNLHRAEAQVLALAKELNGIAITDEGIARQVARIYNIQAHGTAYLLLRLVYRGKLSRKEARKAIERMISAGWRLSAEEYAKLISQLEP